MDSPERLKYKMDYDKNNYWKNYLRLRKDTQADIISYIEESGKPVSQLVAELIRAKIEEEKK